MKPNRLHFFFLAAVFFSFNACETVNEINTDISSLQSDVASLKKETQSLQDLRKEVVDLSVQVDEMQNNLQVLRGRVDENQHSLQKNLKELRARNGSNPMVAPTPTPTPGLIPPTTSSPMPSLDAEEVYTEAYKIFQEGRYTESRAAFVKFLQEFSQTEYSDNAQYWIGETYLKEGKTEEAILAFEDVTKKYPQGNKVPDALVKQGICFKIIGDKDNARIVFQRVIDKFPNTPQANTAQKEIGGLL